MVPSQWAASYKVQSTLITDPGITLHTVYCGAEKLCIQKNLDMDA